MTTLLSLFLGGTLYLYSCPKTGDLLALCTSNDVQNYHKLMNLFPPHFSKPINPTFLYTMWMVTLKLTLKNKPDFNKIQKDYNKSLRFAYKRLSQNTKPLEVDQLLKPVAPNFTAFFLREARLEAERILNLNGKGIIFGGKKNFFKRKFHKITKEEYQQKRLHSITVRGEKDQKGNRLFNFDIQNSNTITFKPDRHTKILIQLPTLSKNQTRLLHQAEALAHLQKIPISVKLTPTHIYLTFDESKLRPTPLYQPILNRTLALDLNPNYIGLSICDYKPGDTQQKTIHHQIFDLTELTKTHNPNKIHHELFQISKAILKLCRHYRVETLGLEDLVGLPTDLKRGRKINRLCNNDWPKETLTNNLKKWCSYHQIRYQPIPPQYSSFIGQLQNPSLPDPIAASLEINRRANTFTQVYLHTTLPKNTRVVFPPFDKSRLPTRWKEMAEGIESLMDWKTLYYWYKKSGLSYRFHWEKYRKRHRPNVFSLQSCKSLTSFPMLEKI